MSTKRSFYLLGWAVVIIMLASLLAPSVGALATSSLEATRRSGNQTGGMISPAGSSQQAGETSPQPEVSIMSGTSKVFDLRKLPQTPKSPDSSPIGRDFMEERHSPKFTENPPGAPAPIGSGGPFTITAAAPGPNLQFDGLGYNQDCGGVPCGDGHPPDTNGDVGPVYYVQTVNTAIGIYDKFTGNRVVGIHLMTL